MEHTHMGHDPQASLLFTVLLLPPGTGGVSLEPCLPSEPWLCFLKKTFSTQHFSLPTELQPLCGATLI